LSESNDLIYIKRCFELALKGNAGVAPNPMVGCVIVHNHQIIGEGYHKAYGDHHAEVMAINSVTEDALLPESTVYVNLEPCAHYGKTPPCADLIISRKIKKVVISNTDPHEKVAGKGIEKMVASGIEVVSGVLEKEGHELNKQFFTFHQKKRPYIVLKWAETSDGFMGRFSDDASSKQISNALSNRFVHELRAQSGAILIGTNTAVQDNPSLTTRLVDGKNPLRVVLDSKARIPESHTVFTDGNETIIIGPSRPNSRVEYIDIPNDAQYWPSVMRTLYQRNILQVLVEGGRRIHEQLIDQGLWDEAIVITSDAKWENGVRSPILNNTKLRSFTLDNDTITHYLNR